MRPVIGSALLICPGCGKSFTMEVKVHSIEFKYNGLRVQLMPDFVEHRCEGQQA